MPTDKCNCFNIKINTCSKCRNSVLNNSLGSGLDAIAQRVINGEFGNGEERKQRLAAAGYNYSTVQAEVNHLLNNGPTIILNVEIVCDKKI